MAIRPQPDQRQFNLTINPTGGGGGGGGALTVSIAPASVGGTFVADPTVATGWTRIDFVNTCGIAVNRSAGTVTFSNSVLTDLLTGSPPITLNGILNFTSF